MALKLSVYDNNCSPLNIIVIDVQDNSFQEAARNVKATKNVFRRFNLYLRLLGRWQNTVAIGSSSKKKILKLLGTISMENICFPDCVTWA